MREQDWQRLDQAITAAEAAARARVLAEAPVTPTAAANPATDEGAAFMAYLSAQGG